MTEELIVTIQLPAWLIGDPPWLQKAKRQWGWRCFEEEGCEKAESERQGKAGNVNDARSHPADS